MATSWDVFVCHASEDKDSFVRPLAETLRKLGVSVWYDEFALRPGDSLSSSIDRGIAGSSFGIVVVSQAFIGKRWPEHELRGLVNRDVEDDKKLIPIWNGVSKEQVKRFSPSLSDKIAIDTRKVDAEEAAIQLLREIRPDIYQVHPRAELENLANGKALLQIQNEIEELRNQLADYQCPYCEFALVGREYIEFDERTSGTADLFECGYSTGGYYERPCPFGPDFPELEEYDLRVSYDQKYSKYVAHASPKTDRARSVQLEIGTGSTEEEAREYVLEHYRYLTTPPRQEFRGRWRSRTY